MAECSDSVVSNNVNIQKQSSVVQNVDTADEDKTDKVMEPILIEEIKYKEESRSLLNLFEFFERIKLAPNKNDILTGLIYILMLEYGFVPVEYKDEYEDSNFNYARVLKLSKQLPNNLKQGNVYTFSFILPPFTMHQCNIACVSMADDILVNCSITGINTGHYSIMLDPLIFFTSGGNDVKGKLQNMKGLSKLVKSEICFPTKQTILWKNGVISNCFEGLPPEIILLIMGYLKVKDLVHVGQTCSFLNNVMKTPYLWIRRIRLDFQKTYLATKYEKLRDYYKYCIHVKKYMSSEDTLLYGLF